MRNTRRHKRHPARLGVQISSGDWEDVLQLTTGNVSRGGLFVRCDRPVEVGTNLAITLLLPDGQEFPVTGVVVHVIPPGRAQEGVAPGFGVRFGEADTIDLDLLESIAASHAAGRNTYTLDREYISVSATVLGEQFGEGVETTAHRLVQRSEIKAMMEQRPDPSGTYRVDVPDAPIVDQPPDRAELVEVAQAEIDVLQQPTPAPAEAPPAARSSDPPPGSAARADPVFGVDFGTTYTSIARVAGNDLKIIEDAEGLTMFPSVVSFCPGEPPVVGWPAREKIVTAPSSTFLSPKRLAGRPHDDPRIQAMLAGSPLRTRAGPGGAIVAEVGGEPVSVIQACAEIFKHAAQLAESSLGVPVRRVVISAPLGAMDERRAIRQAAELAGLSVEAVLDEPVAAAMAFGLGRRDELAAIYDFGGGTFDFSLLQIRKGRFTMVGEASDPWLGGDDFDLALANHAADGFEKHTGVDLRQRQVEWQRLRFHCETAKRKLSFQQQVEVLARGMVLSVRGPLNLEARFDRALLARLCGELVDRSLEAVDTCLSGARIRPAQVGSVVMTGGTSRMPLVRERVQAYFQREIPLETDPEHAVVMGNAICGRFVALTGKPPL